MTDHPSKQMVVEDARITFRNFTGRPGLYNSEGDRNFSLLLDKELALQMKADGWRVKQLKPRGEDEEGDYHIKVTVKYDGKAPPRCVMRTSKNKTELGPDEVTLLDSADIKTVDLIINGWWSDMAGGGYGAFLKTIYVTINEDALELKYADMEPLEESDTIANDMLHDIEKGVNDLEYA
jgi:hypothetical protein